MFTKKLFSNTYFHHLKRFSAVLMCLVVLACLVSMSRFNNCCDEIKSDVLRLHILANSDSDEDQNLKLLVRDRILSDTGEVFSQASTYEEAVAAAQKSLPKIIESARDEIVRNGYDYTVSAKLDYADFNTRHYDGYTLPAGDYMAVNIYIGEGEGHNWWCVMYPSICVSASADIDNKMSSDEVDVIKNYDKFKVKFKLLEWYEELKSNFTLQK